MVKDSIISSEEIQKPKPKIEWNERDLKAFTDIGITPPEHVCMFEKRFLKSVLIQRGNPSRELFRLWFV